MKIGGKILLERYKIKVKKAEKSTSSEIIYMCNEYGTVSRTRTLNFEHYPKKKNNFNL